MGEQPPRGYPPFRMKAVDAAYYTGMSISSFHLAVSKGEMPAGRKATGGCYWLREDLEKAMVDKTVQHDFSRAI